MSTHATILVVDDEPSMLRYIRTVLEVESYRVETVEDGEAAVRRIQRGLVPDVILLDVLMPGMDGLQTLEVLRRINPRLKIVMLSCVSDTRKVVQAIRSGAQDYLTKPFKKEELQAIIEQCTGAPSGSTPKFQPGDIEDIGNGVFFVCGCAEMRKLRNQAKLVANVDIPILLLGESGTGKEVLARLIHKYSSRADKIFLKVNCAAVPADLLESELFGYEAGAFTGATHAKPGKFELCNQGTMLLDEIGEMPAVLQAKLLHVLQDQQFSRLGGRNVMKVDVRIMAATNIDVEQAIAAKRLREDLYYRLNGFTLHLPPLRERKEEIPLLLKHLMQHTAERYVRSPLPLTPSLLEACQSHPWPGNLREVANFIRRYLILNDEQAAIAELQPARMERPKALAASAGAGANGANDANGLKSLVRGLKDVAEAEAIANALEQTSWNRKKAAGLLKISYKALLYKIRQYHLEPDSELADRP